ncbi:TonB-dependent receptor plug domain-containing protein [Dethiosulfatarculus sandiegensis]|uniref:TonB-denpendent receptor n=1 Tax=Dethiosulfatarculus sandiegensis TaxID=1429043 RepID=A0A0D2JU49_9BACT|nr:TonB-dependent receptor [Dethiosulfatarculus sandiegensis]KIX12990.1 hypothetical protein X474_16200 [Dethiosulfatarculus sandiegensis]
MAATTVTAGRIDQQILDVTVPVQTISSEEIRASGFDNLGDVISMYVTGHITKYNGVLTSVGIRGFRMEAHGDDIKGYVLMLVDGHRVGSGNAAKIDMDRIERIEVLKGPYSSLYGSAAMGGVINLITKKGDGPLGGKIRAEFGSFDYLKTGLSGGGEVDDKFKFYLNTSYLSQGDFEVPEYGTVHNTAYRFANFGWNGTYDFTPKQNLRWGGNYSDINGGSSGWANGTYSHYYDSGQSYVKSHGYSDLEYNGSFKDDFLNVRTMVYYLWDRNHWRYGDPDPDATTVKYTDKTIGLDQQFNLNFGSWSNLVAGFTIEKLEKESSGTNNYQPAAPYTPGMEYDTYGLFAQDNISLLDNKLNFVLAMRYDYFDLQTKKPDTGDYNEFIQKSATFDHFSPKAGAAYKLLDDLFRVRTNVGTGFKTPSPDQLTAQYRDTNDRGYLGNPDLNPEKSLTWDLGFDVFHDYADLEVTYWHTDYEDKIVQASKQVEHAGQLWTTYVNLGEAEIAGVDVNANIRLSNIFDWTPNLSLHSRMTFNTKYTDKETGDDLNYVSEYEVKSWLSFAHEGFAANIFYVVVGPQKIQNYDVYPTAIMEKETFDFWNFSASYSFFDNWKVAFNIYNLTDDTYEWNRGYPQAERSYHLSLTFEF